MRIFLYREANMGKRFDSLLFPEGKCRAFTLSYDDGVVQDRRLVRLCEQYGVKCTFNLNSAVLGYKAQAKAPGKREIDISKVDRDEARELYRSHEIGGHGLYHSDLTAPGTPYAMYEILEDKRQLEELRGDTLRMFAYPFGVYNEQVKELLKTAGYRGARTVKSTHSFALPEDPLAWDPTCHHNDEKLFELAEQFLHTPAFRPALFYVWGHAYEFDGEDNWQRIEELLQKVSGNDTVWYAANGEILDYLQAYQRLEYSADGTMIRNPSSCDVWIRTSFENTEYLPAGALTKIRDTVL